MVDTTLEVAEAEVFRGNLVIEVLVKDHVSWHIKTLLTRLVGDGRILVNGHPLQQAPFLEIVHSCLGFELTSARP